MKKIACVTLSLIAFCSANGQVTNSCDVEKVVEVSSNKTSLFTNALQWASSNDPQCSKEIQVQDKDNCSLVTKVVVYNKIPESSFTNYISYRFKFTVKIDCKDGKYRRIISNPSLMLGQADNVSINNMGYNELTLCTKELESIQRIGSKYFQEILDWELSKVFEILSSNEKLESDMNSQIASLTDSKEDKKMRKRMENDLVPLKMDNLLLKEAQKRWELTLDKVTSDIDNTMKQNNDF